MLPSLWPSLSESRQTGRPSIRTSNECDKNVAAPRDTPDATPPIAVGEQPSLGASAEVESAAG